MKKTLTNIKVVLMAALLKIKIRGNKKIIHNNILFDKLLFINKLVLKFIDIILSTLNEKYTIRNYCLIIYIIFNNFYNQSL